jgi:hypothetical protein
MTAVKNVLHSLGSTKNIPVEALPTVIVCAGDDAIGYAFVQASGPGGADILQAQWMSGTVGLAERLVDIVGFWMRCR